MAKDTYFSKQKSLNCKGRLIFLDEPVVMGILNLTPDSFYDGGAYQNEKQLLTQVEKHINEGATILDLGAYSSRPGASFVSESEELNRLIPALKLITKHFPEAILSIDTFRSKVAEEAFCEGASIINDISAGELDSNIFSVVKKIGTPYIMMHMKGTPQNMQQNPQYNNITTEITKYFSEKINYTSKIGINNIIIDPGFGFGKSIAHNYELLNNIEQLKILEKPVLIGISRKSMIYKLLETNPQHALSGTISAHTVSLLKNADILRVHDVKEAMVTLKIVKQLKMS